MGEAADTMLLRDALEAREQQWLAAYALKSADSRGRQKTEPPPRFRTDFQRDRDRIIHSAAFRRLEYKTQVFVNHEGDHYRTRLTHTIEAAQIGKAIARALSLNEDYTEAVILAHDLGHTPFGHAGERVMNELMRDHGGFEHNLQSLRVVDLLEFRYPGFRGLNLTYEVREGIAKHSTPYDNVQTQAEFHPHESSPLEAQIADIADEIAYNNHDVDDGLSGKLLSAAELEEVTLFREAQQQVHKRHSNRSAQELKHVIISTMIAMLVHDLIENSAANLKQHKIDSLQDVRAHKGRLIGFSAAMEKKKEELKDHLMQNMYKHWRVIRMEEKARRILTDLFNAYMEREEQMPRQYREKCIAGTSMARMICDYLAGMTDRFALNEYKRFFDPYERV